MPRKGEMSDQDKYEEGIRAAAVKYNVVVYVPQRNSRVHFSSPVLEDAIAYAEGVFDDPNFDGNPRAAMVHAVDENERFALMGTTNRFAPTFKPNRVKIY